MPLTAIASTPGPAAGVTLFALVAFGVYGVALSAIDIATHRLPNALVLPGYGAGIALCVMASALAADAGALVRAVVGMAVLFAAYATLRLVQPGGMGGGAVDIFNKRGVEVVVGAAGDARSAVLSYLKGELVSTGSVCHAHTFESECGGHNNE